MELPSSKKLNALAHESKRAGIELFSGGLTFMAHLTICQLLGGLLKIHSSTPLGIPNILGGLAVATGSVISLEAATWAGKVSSGNYAPPSLTLDKIFHQDQGCVEENLETGLLGIVLFRALGGKFYSSFPSELRSLGAFRQTKFSLPATEEYAGASQKLLLTKVGEVFGCHSCGSQKRPFIADHMPPKKVVLQANARLWRRLTGIKMNFRGYFPQCQPCSQLQAVAVRANRQQFKYHFTSIRRYHLTGFLLVLSLQCLQSRRNNSHQQGSWPFYAKLTTNMLSDSREESQFKGSEEI